MFSCKPGLILSVGFVLFALLAGPAGVAAAAEVPAGPRIEWVPGRLIVGFEQAPTAETLRRIEAAVAGVRGWQEIPHPAHYQGRPGVPHPLSLVRLAQVDEGADLLALARQIAAQPGVLYAEPDGVIHMALVPNDPLYNQQYGPQIIEAEAAWDITTGLASVVLAVADTGINFGHEEFQAGAIWLNDDPVNGLDDDGNGFIDDYHGWDFHNGDNEPIDGNSHGSHVSGIAAARLNNGLGIAGLANVTIMPIQVFSSGGSGSWLSLVNALYYATDNEAALFNISGGGNSPPASLATAAQYAYDNGVSLIGAAGNFNNSTPFYPGAYPTAIAVSGTDSNDQRYNSSNFGPWVDVAAPAVNILSCGASGPSAYFQTTGTSMAAPHVSGLVALMYSVEPALTPDEVRQLLCDNADDLGAPGFDPYFGCGRINARATLQAVLALGACGDFDGDGDVDLTDFATFQLCFAGSANPPAATCPAGVDADCDNDGDVDLADFLIFQQNFTGSL